VVLFVVARDRRDLYDHVHAELSGEPGFAAVLDRRRTERRTRQALPAAERRRGDRRFGDLAETLARLGYAIARTPRTPTGLSNFQPR
jgi:hypothetical protein